MKSGRENTPVRITASKQPQYLRPVYIVAILLGIIGLPRLQRAQSPFVISGRVTVVDGQTSRPLEGVKLFLPEVPAPSASLNLRPENLPAAVTDASGRFSIQIPTAGRYLIRVTKDGFVYPRRRSTPSDSGVFVDVRAGLDSEELQIFMVPEASIAGKVLDSGGRAVVKVPVSLLQYSYDVQGKRRLTIKNSVPTDDVGGYRFFGLSPGEYYLRVYSGGPAGRWPGMYYPGSVDEQRATPLVVKAGDALRLNTIPLIERETVPVRLLFPDTTEGTGGFGVRTIHFADGSSFGNYTFDRLKWGNELVLELARDVYDVTVSWGSTSESQNYSTPLRLDGTATSISQAIVPAPVVRVTTNLRITGNEQELSGLRCVLTSTRQFITAPCQGEVRVPPGLYGLNVEGLPRDAYVLSAGVGGQDILAGEVSIQEDAQLSVVLRRPGASIEGIVRGPGGEKLPHATVVLIPDPALRKVALRYRSVMSDIGGHFDLGGIAPGAYKLFAWQDLDGAAYRNAQFLEPFEQSGLEVRIESNEHHSLDLRVLLAQ